jgi:hypothetical protein
MKSTWQLSPASDWLAAAGSNEIRSRRPVAAPSRSSVPRRRLHPAAFETCDHRLRRVHALGQLLLREAGTGARLSR